MRRAVTRTYVDAGVLIAGSRASGAAGGNAFEVLSDPDREFVGSVFLRLEVLPKAAFHRNSKEVAFYEEFFSRVVAWASPMTAVIERAEWEAARYGLNALDALHVAAAVLLGADELVTTEAPRKPIHRTASIRVVGI